MVIENVVIEISALKTLIIIIKIRIILSLLKPLLPLLDSLLLKLVRAA